MEGMFVLLSCTAVPYETGEVLGWSPEGCAVSYKELLARPAFVACGWRASNGPIVLDDNNVVIFRDKPLVYYAPSLRAPRSIHTHVIRNTIKSPSVWRGSPPPYNRRVREKVL